MLAQALQQALTHGSVASSSTPCLCVLQQMFGYPSGLGALIVRKDASQLLSKLYFGGGAVDYCTAEDVWHVFSPLPAGETAHHDPGADKHTHCAYICWSAATWDKPGRVEWQQLL